MYQVLVCVHACMHWQVCMQVCTQTREHVELLHFKFDYSTISSHVNSVPYIENGCGLEMGGCCHFGCPSKFVASESNKSGTRNWSITNQFIYSLGPHPPPAYPLDWIQDLNPIPNCCSTGPCSSLQSNCKLGQGAVLPAACNRIEISRRLRTACNWIQVLDLITSSCILWWDPGPGSDCSLHQGDQ